MRSLRLLLQLQATLGLVARSRADTSVVWPSHSFRSSSFTPPVFEITKSGDALQDSYIIMAQSDVTLLNPGTAEFPANVMIVDDDGNLVWNGPEEVSSNLNVQIWNDEQVLTYWAGNVASTEGYYGEVYILNSSYATIKTICPDLDIVTPLGLSYSCNIDLHEQYITEWGTILVTVTNVTTADLSSIGGPADGWVYDSLFFEYDLDTDEELFRWSAIEHVPVSETVAPHPSNGSGDTQSNPYAWFHMNSVQPLGEDGGYLVNSRFCSAAYRLDADGNVIWTIAGWTADGGDFSIPSNGHFSYEHEARLENLTDTSATIHFFNDANSPYQNGTNQSTGLVLDLDFTTNTSTLVANFYDADDEIFSTAQGSFEPLANGNWLAGYGTIPKIKEFGPDGSVRLTMQFGYDYIVACYRAHKADWVGYPTTTPDVYALNGMVYVSWNGATEVAYWNVYSTGILGYMSYVGSVNKTGFETSYNTSIDIGYLQVGAYTADGEFLGNSSEVLML